MGNNLSERSIKHFVIGRKTGSSMGACIGVILYSFIETCKFHQVDNFS
ncbi:hypothetical protein FQU71_09165 [Legionella longbeachae]|nr:hypothetical protein [Legionella longbeachae]QEY53220.1 hypothetical protein FQU71_09165 [Legionella longbeachae]